MLTTASALRKDTTQPTRARFQHAHFAEIARIIRSSSDDRNKAYWIAFFTNELAGTNPKFDRARFIKACEGK